MKSRDDHHHRSQDEPAKLPTDVPERDTQASPSADRPEDQPNSKINVWKGRAKRAGQTAVVVAHGVIRSVSGTVGEPAQMRVEPVVPTATQSQTIKQETPVSTRPTAPPPQQAQAHVDRDPVIDDEPAREKREPPNLTNRHDLGAAHSPPPDQDDPFVRPKSGPQPDAQRSNPPRPVTPER